MTTVASTSSFPPTYDQTVPVDLEGWQHQEIEEETGGSEVEAELDEADTPGSLSRETAPRLCESMTACIYTLSMRIDRRGSPLI